MDCHQVAATVGFYLLIRYPERYPFRIYLCISPLAHRPIRKVTGFILEWTHCA